MTIRFRCKCGRKFEVPDKMAGRKARCTDCGLTFLVPAPKAPAPKATTSPAPKAPRTSAPKATPPKAPAPKTPAPKAPVDDSPLAQAARAAQAAKKAPAASAETPAKSAPAQPAPSQAVPPKAKPKRPAAPAPKRAPRPAAPAPAVPSPPPPADTYALQDDEDDVPVARLASPATQAVRHVTHLGRRRPKLTAVQIVAGVSILLSLVVLGDSLVTTMTAFNNGARGWVLVYGVAAGGAAIGIILALAAMTGNRFCIGVLFGGGVVNIFNGPLMMLFSGFALVQGGGVVAAAFVAGGVAFLSGVAYILLPLLSKPIREYMFASVGVFVGGTVAGFLLGPAIASTAQPSFLLLPARATTYIAGEIARDPNLAESLGIQVVTGKPGEAAKPGKLVLSGDEKSTLRQARMKSQMGDIHKALASYMGSAARLPADLGILEKQGMVPIKAFFCPSRSKTPKVPRNAEGHFLQETDVIYVFRGGRSVEQVESAANAAELIVAHSGPKCDIGDGVLVIRVPRASETEVEWLDKKTFEQQLKVTKEWLETREKPKSNLPSELPGFD